MQHFPFEYDLSDGTHVFVNQLEPQAYEFHLTRLNSEKYNFAWTNNQGIEEIEDSYELRFSELEQEAIQLFKTKMQEAN